MLNCMHHTLFLKNKLICEAQHSKFNQNIKTNNTVMLSPIDKKIM